MIERAHPLQPQAADATQCAAVRWPLRRALTRIAVRSGRSGGDRDR